jgi:hypothetical protein
MTCYYHYSLSLEPKRSTVLQENPNIELYPKTSNLTTRNSFLYNPPSVSKETAPKDNSAPTFYVNFFFALCNVHSRKQKLTAVYIQIACQAVQSSSELYDFFCSFISFISAFSQI